MRAAAGALASLVLVISIVVFPTSSFAAGPPQLRTPLASAVSTSTGSWAIAAMGRLNDPSNTFWELFFRAPAATRWSLVTPPGVADNGGLVAGTSSGPLTIGFEPSQLLRYSPLAQTTDGGAHWTPALLPTALAAVPDALAYEPAGPGVAGRALALVRSGVLASTASLAIWVPLVSTSVLNTAGTRSCGVNGIGALALGPGDVPLVGTGCRRAGQVGVFTQTGRLWQSVGPTLGGSLSGSATGVLRLDVAGSLTAGLVAAYSGRGTSLVAVWRPAGGSWTVSAPLPVGAHATLLSTGVGADGELLVLFGSPGRTPTLAVISPGGSWTRRPAPPSGAVTLAPMSDGSVDAFGVNGSALRVYTLPQRSNTWVRSQSMAVPIAYGPSH
jgi:hypothetical protein